MNTLHAIVKYFIHLKIIENRKLTSLEVFTSVNVTCHLQDVL